MLRHMKFRNAGSLLILIPALAAGAVLLAASAGVFSAEDYPKAIRDAVDAGLKVAMTFPAASGLTGWVLSQDGRYSAVLPLPTGKPCLPAR
jgi:thiol:disulfide interchange protein DsbG